MHEKLLKEYPRKPLPFTIREASFFVIFACAYSMIHEVFISLVVFITVQIGIRYGEEKAERKQAMKEVTNTFITWVKENYRVDHVYAPISFEIFDPWVKGILQNDDTAKSHVITENGKRFDYTVGLEDGTFVLKPANLDSLPIQYLTRNIEGIV